MFIIESITTYITTFIALFVGYLTYKWLIYPFYFSPLRNLPGPSPDNFILGNLNKTILKSGGGLIHVEWTEKYGGIYKFYGLFNDLRIAVTDEQILQRILVKEPYFFVKPKKYIGILKKVLGHGILVTDGEVHKKQRKLMSPAFSNVNVKDMVPSIAKIGNRLKELWKKEIENNQKNVGKNTIKINFTDYMSKATLDAIGIIGFDYEFDSLTSTSELAQAYDSIFNPKNIYGLVYIIITGYFPILKKVPIREKRFIEETSRIIDKVTTKLVREKLDKYVKGELENKKDLLSNLIKSNHEEGLDENEKMGFDELKNQIMTFLLAGHETTGVSITWALYYLSKHQGVQNKLRKEIVKEFPDKDFVPTFEQVNSLEYLNAVCKEVLRVASPVTYTLRSTAEDTTINGYFIPKDTEITIPMYAIHNMPSTWGPDVEKFNPERWISERTKNITNCNYLPFLTGPKGCIGNKMAYCEMRVFLVILIRNFEFHEVEGLEVKKTQNLTLRPDPAAMSWIKETNN